MLHSEPRAFSDPELRHWGAPGSWAGKLGFGTPEGLPDNPLPREAQALHISTLCSLQTTHLYPSAHKPIQVPGFDPPTVLGVSGSRRISFHVRDVSRCGGHFLPLLGGLCVAAQNPGCRSPLLYMASSSDPSVIK